jgi:L-serine kinase (ATP) / ParB family transcriptional regulator, heme-responsive regulator
MPHLPLLRVVPLESIRRHEEIDPLRVERLVGRIEAEGVQVNPMVCSLAPDGELILLDGATRTESLQKIGLEHAVVQMVERETVTLEAWHHVVRGCEPDELVAAVGERPDLILSEDEGTPGIHLKEGGSRLVLGEGVSANATLSSMVGSYVGKWRVSRVADPGIEAVNWSFPDWSAVVEFPTLSLDDVMKAAITDDLLPAGVTRFLVDERALLLNAPLELLAGNQSIEAKQDALDELIADRAQDGRVRRYEETVYIFDE